LRQWLQAVVPQEIKQLVAPNALRREFPIYATGFVWAATNYALDTVFPVRPGLRMLEAYSKLCMLQAEDPKAFWEVIGHLGKAWFPNLLGEAARQAPDTPPGQKVKDEDWFARGKAAGTLFATIFSLVLIIPAFEGALAKMAPTLARKLEAAAVAHGQAQMGARQFAEEARRRIFGRPFAFETVPVSPAGRPGLERMAASLRRVKAQPMTPAEQNWAARSLLVTASKLKKSGGGGEREPQAGKPTAGRVLQNEANDELSAVGSAVHKNVPPYPGKGPTRGVLRVGDVEIPLVSGESQPGQWLMENLAGGAGSGRTFAWKHVEGHVAGIMRKHGVMDADLFINQVPCGPGAAACRFVLHKLIPPGAKLRVHFLNQNQTVGTWLFEGGIPKWRVIR
jgi:hypothetical protein